MSNEHRLVAKHYRKYWTWIDMNNDETVFLMRLFRINFLKVEASFGKFCNGNPDNPVALDWHTDKPGQDKWAFVDEHHNNHYRVNLIVKEPESGGEFQWKPETGEPILNWRFLKIFKADSLKHRVTRVVGTRYVISLAIYRK